MTVSSGPTLATSSSLATLCSSCCRSSRSFSIAIRDRCTPAVSAMVGPARAAGLGDLLAALTLTPGLLLLLLLLLLMQLHILPLLLLPLL